MTESSPAALQRMGWREWLALPLLNVPAIKAKVDTGARTSALHTSFIEPFEEDGAAKVRFGMYPLQKNRDIEVLCEAFVVDERTVTDSGGHREQRLVIETDVVFMGMRWPIEVTLTTREDMRFRMLLGRSALAQRCVVDVSDSFVGGRKSKKIYTKARL